MGIYRPAALNLDRSITPIPELEKMYRESTAHKALGADCVHCWGNAITSSIDHRCAVRPAAIAGESSEAKSEF